MQNVTTKKFAEICGVSDANIRGLIGRGKLKAAKDQLGNHLLDIEDPTNREYLEIKRNNTHDSVNDNAILTQHNAQFDANAFERITIRIEELSKIAGQAKLLTDNLIKEESNAKEWQNRYFELQHTCETIRNEKQELEKENLQQKLKIEQLEAEIKELKLQKGLFSWFKK